MNIIQFPVNNFFPGTGKKRFVVLHGTAGGSNALDIARYFRSTETTNNPVSSHYIIGIAGEIVQCVDERNGAFGNGVVTNPHWLGNPNFYTISIEHCKPTSDNSNELTVAQQQSSFELIKDICIRNNIGMHPADDSSGVTGHFAIDPINRARCPGAYPWQGLWNFLTIGGSMQPTANQLKAINDCWDSALSHMNCGPSPKNSGIYNDWVNHYIQGTFYGPPITPEYPSNDWSGKPIIAQEFARGRCEWDGTGATWYV